MYMKLKAIFKIVRQAILGGNFFTYKIISKTPRKSSSKEPYQSNSNNNFAIVMQGPYLQGDSFTLETLRLYRRNFPGANIILSTTSTLIAKDSMALGDLDIEIINNKAPDNPGIANVNFQIVTSSAGVRRARDLEAKYVLKTRTDQRISHPNLDDYLFSLLKTFPIKVNGLSQNERLIACSLNTFKLRLYGVSDMFMFGDIDDMINYWDRPLDLRSLKDTGLNLDTVTWREHAVAEMAEVGFCTHFLRKVGHNPEFKVAKSLGALAEHFIIIDQDAIRLFWNKYTLDDNRYQGFGDFPELTFNGWLMLNASFDKVTFNESAVDRRINNEESF